MLQSKLALVLATLQCIAAVVSSSASDKGFSYYRCVGINSITRSCLFSNLYFQKSTGDFVYFEPDRSVKAAGHNEWHFDFTAGKETQFNNDSDPHTRWPLLYLSAYVHGLNDYRVPDMVPAMEPKVQVTTQLPTDVCHIKHPSVILDTGHMSWHFGHWFIDHFYPIVHRLDQFGMMEAAKIQFLSLHGPIGFFSHMFFQTFTPLPPKVLFESDNEPSIFKCAHGTPDQTCCGDKDWVRFDEILLGMGGAALDNTPLLDAPRHYHSIQATQSAWVAMRARLYRNAGVPLPPVASPKGKILFLDKSGFRRINNLDKVKECVGQRFKNPIETHVWEDFKTTADKLRFLSDVSLVISTQGTNALLVPLLPDGASVILVGTPNGKYPPFMEWERFFSELGNLHFLFYPVPENGKNGVDFIDKGGDTYHWDTIVHCPRMVRLVGQALDKVERYNEIDAKVRRRSKKPSL